jgi:hypothetical protein
VAFRKYPQFYHGLIGPIPQIINRHRKVVAKATKIRRGVSGSPLVFQGFYGMAGRGSVSISDVRGEEFDEAARILLANSSYDG